MEDDTKQLLEECNSGCKMAINSMEQVEDYIEDDKLRKLVDDSRRKHEKLEQETSSLLHRSGEEEKEPNLAASAFSWFSTEMKLMMRDDSNQIAKLMMDGCNMGIQSVSEYLNDYAGSEPKAEQLAKELVKTEEDFMADLKSFL